MAKKVTEVEPMKMVRTETTRINTLTLTEDQLSEIVRQWMLANHADNFFQAGFDTSINFVHNYGEISCEVESKSYKEEIV